MNERTTRGVVGDLRDAWRWFIGLGGERALVAHALDVRQFGWFYAWLASGLLYLTAGMAALHDPAFAITTVTLFLAADFAIIGFLRLWIVPGPRAPVIAQPADQYAHR